MTYDIRTDGTESIGPDGIYLVWWWSHGSLGATHYPNLQAALNAHRWYNNDDAAFDHIEGPAGPVPDTLVADWRYAYERRAWEAERAKQTGQQQRYDVEIRHPDGKGHATAAEFDHLSDAVDFLGRFHQPGRARIVGCVGSGGVWKRERVIHDWDTTNEQQEAA